MSELRPRSGEGKRAPLEDFITNALAWTLQNTSLGTQFRECIRDKLRARGVCVPVTEHSVWETQVNLSGKRPDMGCLDGDAAILFEHKRGANKVDPAQIGRYKRRAKAKYSRGHAIVVIAADDPPFNTEADIELPWRQVYGFVKESKKACAKEEFVASCFLDLLDSEGLGPMKELDLTVLPYLDKARASENTLYGFAQCLARKPWDSLPGISPDDIHENPLHRSSGRGRAKHRDGRIGVDLLESWSPGIFVGVLVDGRDHRTKPSDPELGPDFSIIMDFGDEFHKRYPEDEHYKALVVRLRELVRQGQLADADAPFDGCRWQFWNHLEECKDPNKWHPIHLRRPLATLLQGITTGEDQVKRLWDVSREGLGILFHRGEIGALRQAMSR
ncbi:MAG: hypothetical protein F4X43_01310 [Acidobacteria bacterium]|nr:hypothetical protein [Acidobacteriota bacterium]MYI38568.1 hypothetical protein [Acidobacteriota bacterium]